jgi:hypothetical protein
LRLELAFDVHAVLNEHVLSRQDLFTVQSDRRIRIQAIKDKLNGLCRCNITGCREGGAVAPVSLANPLNESLIGTNVVVWNDLVGDKFHVNDGRKRRHGCPFFQLCGLLYGLAVAVGIC